MKPASLVCAMFALGVVTAHAQQWPSRPIRMIHGFATGSAIDVFSRPLAQKLSEQLG